ncbi:MAG: HlyD family efflux transporter periplasmic adaptor subunit [Clostridia bacterium]|nr:HlyD family efflux transporter periplasmic adaptor subunit [Clostridia bacterium]
MDANKKRKTKRIVRRIIIILIALILVAGIVFGLVKLFKKDDNSDIIYDVVSTGSIVTTVGGSGVATAKDSASITLLSDGKVDEIFVKEGDLVEAGAPLYKISSQAAEDKLKSAEENYTDIKKQVAEIEKQRSELNIKTPYAGIIMNAVSLEIGDTVLKGDPICTLVDNTKMKLSSFFSYSYESMIKVGQAVTVSVPSQMVSLPGKVDSVYKVQRVSDEGSMLFEVLIVLDNPGILTEGMKASATLVSDSGEIITPYEDSSLEYSRKTDIKAKATGPVEYIGMRNYDAVKAGVTLVKLGESDTESELLSLNNKLKTAKESFEAAQEDLEKFNATAPISGTVLSVNLTIGETAKAGTVAISIADTSTMIVNIKIDEKDVSYVKAGMPVTIDQWGTPSIGTIESVSLSGTYENGVSTFPGVVTIDNSDGALMSGSYVNWKVDGNQSENCLILPIQSVKYVETEEGPKTVVFVQSDSRPDNAIEITSKPDGVPDDCYPVPVTVGISDNFSVEILDGVSEGDTVFTQVRKQSTWDN